MYYRAIIPKQLNLWSPVLVDMMTLRNPVTGSNLGTKRLKVTLVASVWMPHCAALYPYSLAGAVTCWWPHAVVLFSMSSWNVELICHRWQYISLTVGHCCPLSSISLSTTALNLMAWWQRCSMPSLQVWIVPLITAVNLHYAEGYRDYLWGHALPIEEVVDP